MKLYCCGIDWQHEIGQSHDLEGKLPFYTLLEELKAQSPCWEECGIVEVEVVNARFVKEPTLGRSPKYKETQVEEQSQEDPS